MVDKKTQGKKHINIFVGPLPMKIIDKKKIGKQNRATGARFELKVRKDLESKGWVVDRWMNNVEFDKETSYYTGQYKMGLVSAKPKTLFINGRRVIINMWTGFPDFIVFKHIIGIPTGYIIQGIEAKSNGYLDKEEKEKINWLLANSIFSKVLIAMKDKNKRGGIIYKEIK